MPLIFKLPKLNDFLVATTKGRTKPEINRAIRTPLAYTISSVGVYYGAVGSRHTDNDFAYVYHAEKKRDRFAGPSGKKKKVVEGGWTLRVFKIPLSRIKKIKQHERHFVVELAN